MIHINAFTFWGICAIAALGMVRAVHETFFKKDPAAEPMAWAKSKQIEAPEGFKWVLVRDEDLPST